jgi:hypothetical protein
VAKKKQLVALPPEKRIKLRLAYAGPCTTVSHKRGGMYYRIGEDGKPYGNGLVYTGKGMIRNRFVGQVIEIEADNEEGSVIYGSGVHVGMLDDEVTRLEWDRNRRAFLAEAELEAKVKKSKGEAEKLAALEPFREQYRSAIGRSKRAAVLAYVVQYITG